MSALERSVIAVLLLSTGGVGGYLLKSPVDSSSEADAEGEGEDDEEAGISPEAMEVEVATEEATVGDLPVTLTVVGLVDVRHDARSTVSSRASGRVASISVEPGQSVQPGDELMRLERANAALAVAQARGAALEAENRLTAFERTGRSERGVQLAAAQAQAEAEANLTAARTDRVRPLVREGLMAANVLAEAEKAAAEAASNAQLAKLAAEVFTHDGAEVERATLIAQRDVATATLEDAEAILTACLVLAPQAGRVVSISVHRGDNVDAGAPLALLLADSPVLLRLQVPAGSADQIAIGAAVKFLDPRGALRRGEVVLVDTEVNSATNGVEVVVDVDVDVDPESATMRPGQVIDATIEIDRRTNSILVPTAAIVRHDDQTTVVVATAGFAKIVPITLVGRHREWCAIEGDVAPGDRVIVSGAYNLPDGAHVVER